MFRHADPALIEAVRSQKTSLRDAHKRLAEKQLEARAEQARSERRPYEYRLTDGWENQILCGDAAQKLRMVPRNVASLVFFSPPYPTRLVKYDRYEYASYNKWLREMHKVLVRASHALKTGGRMVINVDATSDTLAKMTTNTTALLSF